MAFHPYPQVIPQVFNLGGFGPPRSLTFASACPWQDHSASGLPHATERPVQTRFRSGSPSRVNLATYRNSPAHSSKGTPSRPWTEVHDDALTACKPTVSGSISLPSRGSFHPSLTVLVHYRSPGSIQPYQAVLADSHGISRAPRYSGTPTTVRLAVRVRDSHPLRPATRMPFHHHEDFSLCPRTAVLSAGSHNPRDATPAGYHTPQV